jgi:hypothetical protein
MIGNVTCGLTGREDSCWPPLKCQLDVYYDNQVALPWVREDIVRDVLLSGISSQDFLTDISEPKGISRYRPANSKGIPRVLSSGGEIQVGKFHSGSASVAYFDRDYRTGVGMIGWIGLGVCPQPIGTGHMYFYDSETSKRISLGQIKPDDAKPVHTIEFPESFMRRANAVYQAQDKPNGEVARRLIEQFVEARRLGN